MKAGITMVTIDPAAAHTAYTKSSEDKLTLAFGHVIAALTTIANNDGIPIAARQQFLDDLATGVEQGQAPNASQPAPAIGGAPNPSPQPTAPTAADRKVQEFENGIKALATKVGATIIDDGNGGIVVGATFTAITKKVEDAIAAAQAAPKDAVLKSELKPLTDDLKNKFNLPDSDPNGFRRARLSRGDVVISEKGHDDIAAAIQAITNKAS